MVPAVRFAESEVESAALSWLVSLGYTSIFGPDIAPGEPAPSASPSWRSSSPAAFTTPSSA